MITTVKQRIADIQALTANGHRVREVSPRCYRVNDTLDLYPKSGRFHHLGTEKRGPYTSASACVERWRQWAQS